MLRIQFPAAMMIALTCCLSIPAATVVAIVDIDHDGIDDTYEKHLATKYSPNYIFHPDERYYYIDPELFLNSTATEVNQLFAPFNPGETPPLYETGVWSVGYIDDALSYYLLRTPPAYFEPHALTQFMFGYNADDIATWDRIMANHVFNYECGWNCLQVMPPAVRNKNALDYGFVYTTPIFYLLEENADGRLELQFWAFSHYDNKGAVVDWYDHFGDWSRVILVFAKDKNEAGDVIAVEPPLYTYYSAHRSPLRASDSPFQPRYVVWDDVIKAGDAHAGTHPIVLVSRNQHELYYAFDRPGFDWPWAHGTTYESLSIDDGGCKCMPFLINIHVGHEYFDLIGIGASFVPTSSNLRPLGNGDYPICPWIKFGGGWCGGANGPLGLKGTVRFQEHTVCGNVPGDGGSVRRTYNALSRNAPWPFYCQDDPHSANLVESVLGPLRFEKTLIAYALPAYQDNCLFPPAKAVKISVNMLNGGQHQDLSPSNCFSIHYHDYANGPQTIPVWNNETFYVFAQAGSQVAVTSSRSSGSQDDHYWELVSSRVLTIPETGNSPDVVDFTLRIIEKATLTVNQNNHPANVVPQSLHLLVVPHIEWRYYPHKYTIDIAQNTSTSVDIPVGATIQFVPIVVNTIEGQERFCANKEQDDCIESFSGPAAAEFDFYLQYRTIVELIGCYDYALGVDVLTWLYTGESRQKFNAYYRWDRWADYNSVLEFAPCMHFYPTICTDDITVFNIEGPIVESIDYTYDGPLVFQTEEISRDPALYADLRFSYPYLLWRTWDGSIGNLWLYSDVTGSSVNISSTSPCLSQNFGADLHGPLAAWVSSDWSTYKVVAYDCDNYEYNTFDQGDALQIWSTVVDNGKIGWIQRTETSSRYDVRIVDGYTNNLLVNTMASNMLGYSVSALDISAINELYYSYRVVTTNAPLNLLVRIGKTGGYEHAVGYTDNTGIDRKVFGVPSIFDDTVMFIGSRANGVTLELFKYGEGAGYNYQVPINVWDPPKYSGTGWLVRQYDNNLIAGELGGNVVAYEGKDFDLAGNNCVFLASSGPTPGTRCAAFYSCGGSHLYQLSNDTLTKFEPKISGFNAAWIAEDGEEFCIYYAKGSPDPQNVFADQPYNDRLTSVTCTGEGFKLDCRVFLVNELGGDIPFIDIVDDPTLTSSCRHPTVIEGRILSFYNSQSFDCVFDLTGLQVGDYGLLVMNSDGMIGSTDNQISVYPAEMPNVANPISPADGAVNQPLDLTLEWSSAARANNYRLYFGTQSDSLEQVYCGAQCEFSPQSLVNDRTYLWRVDTEGYGGVNEGYYTQFTTKPLAPAAVTCRHPVPGASMVSPEGLYLEWNDEPLAEFYTVVLSSPSDTIFSYDTVDTIVAVASADPNTTYRWRVESQNVSGSSVSAGWNFTTAAVSAPSAPTMYYPISGSFGLKRGRLLWDGDRNASSYRVSYGLCQDSLITAVSYDKSFEISFILPDTLYFWQVTALNDVGEAPGQIVSFRTAPSRPTAFYGAEGALYVDGDGDNLEVPDADAYNLGYLDMTIEAWINPFETPTDLCWSLVSKIQDYGFENSWEMGMDVLGRPYFSVYHNATNRSQLVAENTIPHGCFSHICIVKEDGYVLKVYVNGEMVGTNVLQNSFMAIGSANVTIGGIAVASGGVNSSGVGYFHGQIDEVRIWDYARTQQQIINNMYAPLSPEYYATADSGLIGYWDFNTVEDLGVNEDGADDVRDLSVSGVHGDLTGDAIIDGGYVSIMLTEFTAISALHSIILKWTTLRSFDGFFLDRRFANTDDDWQSLTNMPIIVQDIAGQNLYSYEDLMVNPDITYEYRLLTLQNGRRGEILGYVTTTFQGNMPIVLDLSRNYPNPFNPVTKFDIAIPKNQKIVIEIFDISGKRVATLYNGIMDAGYYSLTWDGHDANGRNVASGAYFCRMVADGFERFTKVMLLK